MSYGACNIGSSEIYKNINRKNRRRENKKICYKIFTLYEKWHDVI